MDTRVTRGFSQCSAAALLAWLCAQPLWAAPAPSCNPAAAHQVRLNVKVTGVDEARGNVTITVYPDQSDRFLAKGGKLARQRVKAAAPTTTACFVLPAAGWYAVAIYHDADDNHDFKRSLVGLPREGYGFSRNPKSLIGLPSLAEVRFEAKDSDNLQTVQLSYP